MEKLEQRLIGQEEERAVEGLADYDDAAEPAQAAANTFASLTPFTKTKTTKDLILKAKALENNGSYSEALSIYRRGK